MTRPSRAVPLPCKIHGTEPKFNDLDPRPFRCQECIDDENIGRYNLLVHRWNVSQAPEA